MAEGGHASHNEDDERETNVERLTELFHGRFFAEQAEAILNHWKGDVDKAVVFALNAPEKAVVEVVGKDKGKKEYLDERQVIDDINRKLSNASEVRQFTCGICKRMWWRKVPKRKMVSKCYGCNRRKTALQRDKEFGWAMFECPCGHVFRDFGAMDVSMLTDKNDRQLCGKSKSVCLHCTCLVKPKAILPPRNHGRKGQQRRLKGQRRKDLQSRQEKQEEQQCPEEQSSEDGKEYEEVQRWQGWKTKRVPFPKSGHCTGYNCYMSYRPSGPHSIVPVCVHPKSLGDYVLAAADSHVSTGSTVQTCVSQEDLITKHNPYDQGLATIKE